MAAAWLPVHAAAQTEARVPPPDSIYALRRRIEKHPDAAAFKQIGGMASVSGK